VPLFFGCAMKQRIMSALLAMGIALQFQAIAHGARLPLDPAQWNLWLAVSSVSAPVSSMPALPTKAATPDAAWLERWGRLSPAIAWNDIVIDLIVKYQQNPLRATRAMALTHAAMHDALVLCARDSCGDASTRIALHVAAGRMLRHLYPQESPGRFDALALSAAYATITRSGENSQTGWRHGHAAAQPAPRPMACRAAHEHP
jgi:hypothetical protein